jgi:hypothetical protein
MVDSEWKVLWDWMHTQTVTSKDGWVNKQTSTKSPSLPAVLKKTLKMEAASKFLQNAIILIFIMSYPTISNLQHRVC